MEINAFVVARNVTEDEHSCVTIEKLLTGFSPKELPYNVAPFTVYALLTFTPEECGHVLQYSLQILDPEGRPLQQAIAPAAMITPDRFDALGRQHITFRFTNVLVEYAGAYPVQLFANQSLLASTSFQVDPRHAT